MLKKSRNNTFYLKREDFEYLLNDDVWIRGFYLMERESYFLTTERYTGLRTWDEFIEDIRKNGIKRPLRVTKCGDTYRVKDGQHRFIAGLYAGLKEFPVYEDNRD